MPAPSSSWVIVKRLFERAVELPPAQRAAFLAGEDVDESVRAEVRSLLAHHDETEGPAAEAFLAEPAAAWLLGAASREGELIGAWQIVRPLGAGGMGEVFEARRADGSFEGRAAIKLLKRGMDSQAVLLRFAQERQALARLNHPHIARLFDAGLSRDGLPYFVMEYVDGTPLDEAARTLSLEQRLGLFLQLADAVAHAHRNLLVHRDLKPGNVLVSSDGQLKLLDFGIAKALDPLEHADADITLAGAQRPFTPHYASPEQVRGEPVSTATDIYSLGVLLYQMLTGVRPTGRDATTPQDAARSVLEETPTRPSNLSADLVADPHWLATRKRLQGDLDNILLKTLEKPAERRYPSVDALAQDVRNFLGGYPVQARAPSWRYLSAKFVLRNRLPVALASAALLALVGGIAATTWQAREARQARNQAQQHLAQTKDVLRRVVQQHADAITFLPGGLPAKEAMLKDAVASLDRIAEQAGTDADLAADLAATYARLADIQGNDTGVTLSKQADAESNAKKALALFAAVPPGPRPAAFHVWHAQAHATRARLARANGRADEAVAQFDSAARIVRDAARGAADPAELQATLAKLLGELAITYDSVGVANLNRPDAALASFEEARGLSLQLWQTRHRSDDLMRLAMIDSSIATVHEKHDRLADALAHLETAAASLRELNADPQHPDTANMWAYALTVNNLGTVQARLGDAPGALRSAETAHALLDEVVRQNPGNASWQMRRGVIAQGHAEALLRNGRHPDALAVYRALESQWREQWQKAAAGTPERAVTQRRLAMNLVGQAECLSAQRQAGPALQRAQAGESLMAELVQAGPHERELLLYHAQALAALAAIPSARAGEWRLLALQEFDSAHAISPLTGDHLRAVERLRHN